MSEELLRNDEPSDENEVEGHRKRHMANDEPTEDEGSEETEVEAHRFRKTRPKKD